MFKDFERISKESQTKSTGAKTETEDPFAKLLGGLAGGEAGGEMDDAQMMNMFKGLMGSLGGEPGSQGGKGGPSDDQMNEIMKEFTSFLSESEAGGNNEFRGALQSVVKDIVSKESLYVPMKKLKDALPDWLENNWDKVSGDDLERYNKQLDKVTEVCTEFEKEESDEQKEKVFELLNEL